MTRYDAQMPDVIDAEAWAAIRAASEADAADKERAARTSLPKALAVLRAVEEHCARISRRWEASTSPSSHMDGMDTVATQVSAILATLDEDGAK